LVRVARFLLRSPPPLSFLSFCRASPRALLWLLFAFLFIVLPISAKTPKTTPGPGDGAKAAAGSGSTRTLRSLPLVGWRRGRLHATPILSREAVGNHTVLPLYLYVLKLLMLCTSSNSRSRSRTPLDSIQTALEGVVNIHHSQFKFRNFTSKNAFKQQANDQLLSMEPITGCCPPSWAARFLFL
jgi:hypothetical protein